jgi:hypothetical protein
MFPRSDVIDFVGQGGVDLRKLAILAAVAGALRDLATAGFGHDLALFAGSLE